MMKFFFLSHRHRVVEGHEQLWTACLAMVGESSTTRLSSIEALLGPRAQASLRTGADDGVDMLASQIEALKAETKSSKEAVLSLRGTVAGEKSDAFPRGECGCWADSSSALSQTVSVLQRELQEARSTLSSAQTKPVTRSDVEEAVREAREYHS